MAFVEVLKCLGVETLFFADVFGASGEVIVCISEMGEDCIIGKYVSGVGLVIFLEIKPCETE